MTTPAHAELTTTPAHTELTTLHGLHKELVAAGEVGFWPKNLSKPFVHTKRVCRYESFLGGAALTNQHALDIVRASAERWLASTEDPWCRGLHQGFVFGKGSDGDDILITEAIAYEVRRVTEAKESSDDDSSKGVSQP